MADIFISYGRKDRTVASQLATRLEAEGWTVFWDHDLLSGEKWPEVIETEVRAACCVVVLWSGASIKARWVLAEANLGIERGILVPALLGPVTPPFGFAELHASNLADWDGVADSPGLEDLIRSITVICGNRKSVTMWPLNLVIVIGRPKRWSDLGATVNMTCKFVNALDRTVTIQWLEASATGPNGRSYYFVWKVLYDTVKGGTEHVRRIDRTARIDVPAGSVETGVQLRAPTLSDEVAWPSGDYTFQLWGWADRQRDGEPANLRTDFKISLSDSAARQVKWLLEADDGTWERLQASDDAIGIPVYIDKVRVGLPAGSPRRRG
jgi:hypothetical protein